jgi:uncharacterized protein (TIGR03083 family)
MAALWEGDVVQLNPRYGTDPLITLDCSPAAILEPAVRQRRRLAATLATLTDEQWAHPSRCDGWSSRDVIVHLDSTNTFWAFSIAQGLKGEPTQFLATFDPVASPAQMVADAGDVSTTEVLKRFVASTETLTDLLTSLDDDDWSVLAEAPPGHVSVSALTHHALWDSWVHERDVLLPLGITPEVEADEVAACLRYGAALAPAFAVNNGTHDHGVLAITVTDPDVSLVVDIGDHVVVRGGPAEADLELTGDAVDVLEALSIRRALDQAVPAEWAWMLSGLAETFDQ